MGSPPVVSVLVTARDNERHVETALRGVLRQTYGNLELLVVDDGSRDSTPSIVAAIGDERLRLTRHTESAGISARRNELLERAHGRYVAPLDADDVWLPNRLQRHVAMLEGDPELVGVGSDVLVVDEGVGLGPYFRLPRSDLAVRWTALFSSPVIHSASTIRASAFAAGVRYDTTFPLAQDFDLWVQLLRHGRVENVPEPLSLYRAHGSQASMTRAGERRVEHEAIGLRAIDALGGVTWEQARLAWRFGAQSASGTEPLLREDELEPALDAYVALLRRFEETHVAASGLREARRLAATEVLRHLGRATGRRAQRLRRVAVEIDRTVAVSAPAVKLANLLALRRYRGRAAQTLSSSNPARVA